MNKKRFCVLIFVLLACTFLFLTSCSPDLEFADKKVVSVTVDGLTVVSYTAGDSLNLKDVTLHVVYDDDSVEEIPLTESMLQKNSYDMSSPGEQNVVVNYGGASCSFKITVLQWALESVVLYSEPYVTQYVEGESIDLEGAYIRLTYEKSKTSSEQKYEDIPVSEDMLNDYNTRLLGNQTISLQYLGTTMSFDVFYTKKTPTSLKIVDSATNNFVFVSFGDRYDTDGMTLRIGYDNEQSPLYNATTGTCLEEGYTDIENLSEDLLLSIDDSLSGSVTAVMMYRPDDYPEEFTYEYYGTAYFAKGEIVKPGDELASNHIDRNGSQIALSAVTSKSYGEVTSVTYDKTTGRGTITVSTVIHYTVTKTDLKVGDILPDNVALGKYGNNTVYSVGGGEVVSVKDGIIGIRTAPTTTFVTRVRSCSYVSMKIDDIDQFRPKNYPDKTTIDNMIQGDEVDLSYGSVTVTYDDGTENTFGLNSSYITIVNAGASSVNTELDISSSGRHELWIVYGGVIEQHVSFYVTVLQKYPIALHIVESTNGISGKRFYFGDTISIAGLQYYVEFNNETESSPEQVTKDMIGDNCSLYCTSSSGAYSKIIYFQLPDKYSSLIPTDDETVKTDIYSENYSYTVVPQPITAMTVVQQPVQVFVSTSDSIVYDGAKYVIYYRDGSKKELTGKDIDGCKGNGQVGIGGSIVVNYGSSTETVDDYTVYRELYLDDDFKQYDCSVLYLPVTLTTYANNAKLPAGKYFKGTGKEYQSATVYNSDNSYYEAYYIVDLSDKYQAGDKFTETYYLFVNGKMEAQSIYRPDEDYFAEWNDSGKTRIGKWYEATITYSDNYCSDYETDISREKSLYYQEGDTYKIAQNFVYYTIDDEKKDYLVKSIKVNCPENGLEKGYKAEYAQYEEWDFEGITITIKTENGTDITIDATPAMVYDSSTSIIADNIPVKFSYLGAIDDSSLKINVVEREESSLETVISGKNTYSSGNVLDFSEYTFHKKYTGGTFEVIENLTGVKTTKQADGWWYALYFKWYFIYDDKGNIVAVDEDGNITVYSGTDYNAEDLGYNCKSKTDVETVYNNYFATLKGYTIDYQKGTQTTAISGQYDELIAVLHHSCSATETRGATDISVDIPIAVMISGSKNVIGIAYIGQEDEYDERGNKIVKYIDSAGLVEATQPAGYTESSFGGSADAGFAILNHRYQVMVLTDEGEEIGYINNKIVVPVGKENIYYDTQTAVELVLNKLLNYSIQVHGSDGYCIMNGNNAVVDYSGLVGSEYFYSERAYAENALIRFTDNAPYYWAKEGGKYVIKNRLGKFVISDGHSLVFYYDTRLAAQAVADTLNAAYVKSSSHYSVSDSLFVMAELVAKTDVMLSEYDMNLKKVVDKELTVYYDDGTQEVIPITADMLSYDVIDSSEEYRRVTISYQGSTYNVFVRVWNATLVDVDIYQKPLTNYIRGAELDLSGGILQLKFDKLDSSGNKVGDLYKYIDMENDDVTNSGFVDNLYSKEGEEITISLQYKDYEDLTTSFVITVYDKQDVSLSFSDTISFYGTVKAASFSASKKIEEFTLPDQSTMVLYYVNKKDFIPYKQFEAMNLSETKKQNYLAVTVYDDEKNLAMLYYVEKNIKSVDHYYDPAEGTFYAVYSAYVLRDSKGHIWARYTKTEYEQLSDGCLPGFKFNDVEYEALTPAQKKILVESDEYYYLDYADYVVIESGVITKRYTATEYAALSRRERAECTEVTDKHLTDEEYNALSEEEKALCEAKKYYIVKKSACEKVTGDGDILYMYTEEEYNNLSSEISALCKVVNNEYYLMVSVTGNEYYESGVYALQTYGIIPANVALTVVTPSEKDYLLRVTTGNTIDDNTDNDDLHQVILFVQNGDNLKPKAEALKATYSWLNNIYVVSPNTQYFEFMVEVYEGKEIGEGELETVYYELLLWISEQGFIDNQSGLKFGTSSPYSDFSSSSDAGKVSEMKTAIKNRIVKGINLFALSTDTSTLTSDENLNIVYSIEYGSMKTRNGKLQLLSGKLALSYDENTGKYKTVQGTLAHSSYTLTISAIECAVSTKQKKNIEVEVLSQDADDYVYRVYVSNGNEVYSDWVLAGKFEKKKAEIKANETYKFIEEIAVISPNKDYLEIRFTMNSNWNETSDMDTLESIFYALLSDMMVYGAEDVYYGDDLTLFGKDMMEDTAENTAKKLWFFEDGTEDFTKEIVFDGKVDTLSDYYRALYATIDSEVRDSITVKDGIGKYFLKVRLSGSWNNTSEQRNALFETLYTVFGHINENGGNLVLWGDKDFDEVNEKADFISYCSQSLTIGKTSYAKVSFTYDGDLYKYIVKTLLSDCQNAGDAVYKSVSDEEKMVILTDGTIDRLQFVYTKGDTAKDATKLDTAFATFMMSVINQLNAKKIYYGKNVYIFTEETEETTFKTNITLKKGVNIFTENSKDLYFVSYTVNSEDLIVYDSDSMLPEGECSADYDGTKWTYDKGTMSIDKLYNVTVVTK